MPAKKHHIELDAECVREGSASAFMICAPHLGRREVEWPE